MSLLFYLPILVIIAWFFDRTCLWLEREGYLYYRNVKPQKGIIGAALQELNAQLLPTRQHVIVAQQQQATCKKNIPSSSSDFSKNDAIPKQSADTGHPLENN